jgi:hypothetical protein
MTKTGDRDMRHDGWERIAKVEPEIWLDQNGTREFELVWLITDKGDVYQRSILSGETAESVAKHYRQRGLTDSRCILFKDRKSA